MFNDTQPVFEFRGPWGVPVQIGTSFLFLFIIYLSFAGTPRDFAYDIAFLGMLVLSIFLHEMGHAWGCLIQGVQVRRVMLHGFGGYCERARSATRYEQELIVAMGPIVTLVLWAVCSLIAGAMENGPLAYGNLHWAVMTMAWLNGFLAVFNLLPVQPLDGGKLFELILARFMHPASATKVAGILGIGMVLAWLPLMIFGYLTYGMLLLFIPSLPLHLAMARTPWRGGVRR